SGCSSTSAPTACTCSRPAGSRARATSSLPATSSAKAMRRRRREVPHFIPPRNGEGDQRSWWWGPTAARYGGGPPPPRRFAPRFPSPYRGGFVMTAPFPPRKQEEWRYADLDALQPVWEQFAEPVTLTVGTDESFEDVWLPTADDVQVRRVQIALEKGSKACLFMLNAAPVYGRIELDVSL